MNRRGDPIWLTRRDEQLRRTADREHQLQVKRDERRATRERRLVIDILTGLAAIITALGVYLGYVEFREQRNRFFDERNRFAEQVALQKEEIRNQRVEQKTARMVRAWEILRLAQQSKGNVGQIAALETLFRGGENIQNLALGCAGKQHRMPDFLPGNCKFFKGVDLATYSSEKGSSDRRQKWAIMSDSDFTGANLIGAKLTGAVLIDAELAGANLTLANMTRVNLVGANLTGARLPAAKLMHANLIDADLTDAILVDADLTSADVTDATLTGVILVGANLGEVIGLTQSQIESARPSPPPQKLSNGVSWPFEEIEGRWVKKGGKNSRP